MSGANIQRAAGTASLGIGPGRAPSAERSGTPQRTRVLMGSQPLSITTSIGNNQLASGGGSGLIPMMSSGYAAGTPRGSQAGSQAGSMRSPLSARVASGTIST